MKYYIYLFIHLYHEYCLPALPSSFEESSFHNFQLFRGQGA